jgi:hypothetical protein
MLVLLAALVLLAELAVLAELAAHALLGAELAAGVEVHGRRGARRRGPARRGAAPSPISSPSSPTLDRARPRKFAGIDRGGCVATDP